MTLGKTVRLHAAGMASAVLLRIILAELDREITGPGWCVIGRQVGEEVVHFRADAPVTAAFIASIDSLANCFCFLRTYG